MTFILKSKVSVHGPCYMSQWLTLLIQSILAWVPCLALLCVQGRSFVVVVFLQEKFHAYKVHSLWKKIPEECDDCQVIFFLDTRTLILLTCEFLRRLVSGCINAGRWGEIGILVSSNGFPVRLCNNALMLPLIWEVLSPVQWSQYRIGVKSLISGSRVPGFSV